MYKSHKKMRPNEREMIRCLSEERLQTYKTLILSDSSHDLCDIYIMVNFFSSLFFLPLQFVEITLRNRMHSAITEHFIADKSLKNNDPADWLHWMPNNKTIKNRVLEADKRAKQDVRHRDVVLGDVISRISFGTWVSILEEHPNNRAPFHFWQYTASTIFPNLSGRKQHKVVSRFREINRIRNRLFHFEPVWNTTKCKTLKQLLKDLERKYDTIIETLQWMSKDIDSLLIDYKALMSRTFSKYKNAADS